MKLKGQTFIVTGASRGIGEALALELARAGAHLVIGARNQKALEFVRDEVQGLGVRCLVVAGSVASAAVAEAMVKAALEIGNFVGFIHNAGVLNAGPLAYELIEAQYDEIMDSNVKGGYQLARFAYPHLIRQPGSVAVFLGSGVAEHNIPGMGIYAIAKAAEEHLVRQLAVEAPEVTCFTFRPGIVETEMQRQLREAQGSASETLRPLFRGYQSQGRVLTPEQSARALVRILEGDPRRFHGKIATVTDGS
ncbi:SDR family NAD(P)-dependent oxidoreductase [Meiothermus ruber]|uniref:SDR family NAD(P)-dependent oxidoreductase n=1 Tax=Meiothermus ruber TaxID=277 RepID=UPI00034794A5|nr:SDR family oxidoreductase [Meiothermus ruber]GAO75563.1 short-chain dehydrogenase/reductase SDR [Meiothermus ruber H328]